jgi:hypothetical protein
LNFLCHDITLLQQPEPLRRAGGPGVVRAIGGELGGMGLPMLVPL